MPYYVYVILCESNNFYTGYTRDLNARMKQHMKGKAAKYTKMYKPQKIVYVEETCSRAEAMKREKNIKRLNHKQKIALTRTKQK